MSSIPFTGDDRKILPSTPYVPSQAASASRTESTIFDQVYGGYRRRPAMISLNVQWMPVSGRSGTYQWSGNEMSNRKVKTVTFFGTGEMRGQQSAKVTTPPSSDYTDAYLSAFASKPIPTRHIHQLNTSIFANSTPIPLKPTSIPFSVTKTSETRFVDNNDYVQQSKSFDTTVRSSSNRSSTYSSSFIPERPAPYDPFSSTQYSSPQSQTFTSSYSTLLRSPTSPSTTTLSPSVDSQRSFSTIQTRSQPSPSTFPTVYRSDTPYENVFKPMPPYSVQSYPPSDAYTKSLSSSPTGSTYKPYVPFQSPTLYSSNISHQSSTTKHVVLPTPTIEKQIDRPETLLFQHDEDIRPSQIEKPSPFYSPSPESPVTRKELQIEPERLHMEELPSSSSEPIQILEDTLSKYDSLINQISEVLASVSPLSSTVSSMSPGKSVLDYELSSDGSPILARKGIESQQPLSGKSTSTQRTKSSHLIRGDSYDKIVTAISDLDNEIISPSDVPEVTTTIKEEKEEVSTPSLDESPVSAMLSGEEPVKSNVSLLDEDRTQSQTEQDTDDIKTPLIPEEETRTVPVVEQSEPSRAEEEIRSTDLSEHQTSPGDEENQPATLDEEQASSTGPQRNQETTSSVVEEQQVSSSAETEDEERTTISTNEQQTVSVSNEGELDTSPTDDQQISTITEEGREVVVAKPDEQKVDDTTKASIVDQSQSQAVQRDEAIVSLSDEQQLPLENETEKLNTESIISEEEQISSTIEKEPEETTNQFIDESQSSSTAEKELTPTKSDESNLLSATSPSDVSGSEISQFDESKSKESNVDDQQSTVETETKNAEFIQEQTGLLTNVPTDVPVSEETESTSASTISNVKAGKRVTWDEGVVDNEDDESSTSETASPTPSDDNSKPSLIDEAASTINEQVSASETVESSSSIDSSSLVDQQVTPSNSSDMQTTLTEQQSLSSTQSDDQTMPPATSSEQQIFSPDPTDQDIRPSSPLQTSLSLSDASEPSETPSSLIDGQTYSASPIDSSKDDTLTVEEASTATTISDVLTYNNSDESTEEFKSTGTVAQDEITDNQLEIEKSSKVEEDIPHGSETSTIDSVLPSLEPTIVSPIDTLSATIANRYISSDVYHGCLGEHNQFQQNEADTDDDATKQSLLASLRQTIAAPITPIIEAIQNVVSSVQTSSETQSLTTESEIVNSSEDGRSLDTTDSSKELKTVLESLRDTAIAPITAIAETIQAAASNFQSEKQEPVSTSTTEKLRISPDDSVSATEIQLTSATDQSSDGKINDDSDKEVEQLQPSLFNTIQEKVSNAITTLTDAVQNVTSSNLSSADTKAEDEQTIQQKEVHAQPSEQQISVDATRGEAMGESVESYDNFLTDTPLITEQTAEKNEKHEITSTESVPSELPEPSSAVQMTEESTTNIVGTTPGSQFDEQVSTSVPIPTENIVSLSSQETPEVSQIDQKIEDTSNDSVSSTEVSQSSQKVFTSTDVPPEPIQIETTRQTLRDSAATSDESNGTTTGLKSDEHLPVENKTTFEAIRDAIAHPLTTITETIQSIMPTSSSEQTEQIGSDVTRPTEDVPEEKESIDQIEQKTDTIQDTEGKTTLETIRDVITHPLATITEKIQNITSTSNAEHVEHGPPDTPESLADVSQQVEISESTEPKTTFETIRDALSHPVSTITQKLQSLITSSNNEEVSVASVNETVDQTLENQQSESSHSESHTPKLNAQDSPSENEHENLNEIVNDLINDAISTVISQLQSTSIESEQINSENFSSETSPITVVNVDDGSESSRSTINQELVPNDATASSTMTWTNLVGEKSSEEKLDQSIEEPADIMQRSTNDLESDSTSAVTEVEQLSTPHLHEPSPPIIEDDSLELIHALQGHSIILPSSPTLQTRDSTNRSTSTIEKSDKPVLQGPDVSSSSTTTSSQVTSSDRYVSYAIHEMGDSSQERLPAFPLAADIPVYQLVKTTSAENKEREVPSELSANVNQNPTKDDDLTEFDATENLTSYSDDVLLQKLQTSASNRRENLDASSTDEDVDDNLNELEQQDTSNLHRIVNEVTHQNGASSQGYNQTYQRYDLSSTSSTSTRPTTDDIYMIPGYPGLWRPSADDDDSSHSALANDADDEDEKRPSESTIKTRTIVRTTDPVKFQSILQQQHPETRIDDTAHAPESTDVFNRPLNEFSFDISESDSFKTCASTNNSSSVSRQQQQTPVFDSIISEGHEHQTSPDEKIFLIRERERGVSLPVTMKIDYDDMALRLSASTPIDAPLYSTTDTDLPSPSAHSEPMQKTTSSSRASTPSLSSNEGEQQKAPSSAWLNTVSTITTTTEGPDGPLEARTTIHKSAKGPISVAECDAQGKFILIENTSRSKSLALAGWKLRQESDSGEILTFTFPDNCLLRPNQSFKVLTRANQSERRNNDLIASSLSSWHTGSNVVTTLINADGKDRASLTKKTLFS